MMQDRDFRSVMIPYVQNENFLQIHMNLLRENSQTIPLNAFHVFKLFVANPNKPQPVKTILRRNSERLMKLLESFKHQQIDEVSAQDLNHILKKMQAHTVTQKV